MSQPRIYIDTNVLKFSATKLPRLFPRKTTINWGDQNHELTVHDFRYVNRNDSIKNQDLKKEAEMLPTLAELGKNGKVTYVMNMETLFESWGLRNMDSETGKFYGVSIETVDAPIQYGRALFGFGLDPREAQFQFLKSIDNKRFLELQRMTGAYQGNLKRNRNQLLDAFHLWCAEHASCDFFLTLDLKLLRVLRCTRNQPKVSAVKPSEILNMLSQSVHGKGA